ncbi:YchJ family protein [Streptomyces sp. NPDC006879]|uniref:YchJ family protein n=1 Tax=Streptomyces sp. NPDC006879 TaxID=3364767 RepID=UPI00369820E4
MTSKVGSWSPWSRRACSARTDLRRTDPRVSSVSPCPCGLPASYQSCCARFHSGAVLAPTAELLMRARFTAFAVGDAGYLLKSWHPDTRPRNLTLDADQHWVRLEILGSLNGGLFEVEGSVEFRAHYREGGHSGSLQENSRFVRENGAWLYVGPLSPVVID